MRVVRLFFFLGQLLRGARTEYVKSVSSFNDDGRLFINTDAEVLWVLGHGANLYPAVWLRHAH